MEPNEIIEAMQEIERKQEDFEDKVISACMIICTITIIGLLFLMGGCANTEIDREIQHDYYEAVKSQAQSRSSRVQQNPTIQLQCGEHQNACKGLNFSYTDPTKNDGMVSINRARTTSEVNAEAFRTVIPNVIDGTLIGIGIYKGADILSDAIKGANNAITSITTTTNTNTSVEGESNTMDSSSGNTNGNERDTINNDSNDTNTVDSNDVTDSNDVAESNNDGSVSNSYPITDSNNDNSNNSDNSDASDNSNNSDNSDASDNSQQNETATPNYPPGAE